MHLKSISLLFCMLTYASSTEQFKVSRLGNKLPILHLEQVLLLLSAMRAKPST
jgi:hypothetical protein